MRTDQGAVGFGVMFDLNAMGDCGTVQSGGVPPAVQDAGAWFELCTLGFGWFSGILFTLAARCDSAPYL